MSSYISHKEVQNQKLKRKYEFTVIKDYINEKIEQRLLDQRKVFNMSGFRKGKVPIEIVKAHKGREVSNTTISDEIKNISENFFKENNLVPINTPEIIDINFDENLKYSVAIELIPEVPLIEIAELEIEKEYGEITSEDIAKHVKFLSENSFELLPASKSYTIEKYDTVIIDFVGKIDNQVFEGGQGKDFVVRVGSGEILSEIEEGLIGYKANDDLIIDAEFPDDYPMKKLAKKKAKFLIKIKKIMARKQITNENKILNHFSCKTENEFKEKAKQGLEHRCEFMVNALAKREIFAYLNEKFLFDVPESLVEAEAKKMSDKVTKEIMEKAEERVRVGFILMGVAQKKSIKITEEDISRALIGRAQGDKRNMQYIINVYKNNPMASATLKGEILENKVMQFIIDALRKKVEISFKELEDKFNKTMEG